MQLLIDGHNVIFACGLYGKHANSESLARARLRLLREISTLLPPSMLPQVSVVFDAKRIPLSGQKAQEFFGPITVYYSIHHPSADELIEQLIADHPAPRQLLIVSSDHRLQNEGRRRRASVIDSDQWYFDELHREGEPSGTSSDVTDDEIETDEKEGLSLENPFPDDYLKRMSDEFPDDG